MNIYFFPRWEALMSLPRTEFCKVDVLGWDKIIQFNLKMKTGKLYFPLEGLDFCFRKLCTVGRELDKK